MSAPKRIVETQAEQLRLWVAGESVHVRTHLRPPNDYECCPDFSCCTPSLLAPKEVRERFAAATQHERGGMLAEFFGAMIVKAAPGKKIYITGG